MSGAGEPAVLTLWDGPAPGSETWTHDEGGYVEHRPGFPPMPVVTGVRTPSVEVRPANAAGGAGADTLVLICPGGGFQLLALRHEGSLVAERLLAAGVSAAILRYRTEPPGARDMTALRQEVALRGFDAAAEAFAAPCAMAAADALQAVRVLRRAADPQGRPWRRIGLLGFSAGAALALSAALQAPDSIDFVAALYGWADEAAVLPPTPPPLFLATAADDESVPADRSLRLHDRWRGAGGSAELHVYARGGHGFGAIDRGLPADRWTDAFLAWLDDPPNG